VTITVEAAGGKKASVKGTIGFASPVIEGVGTSRQFACGPRWITKKRSIR